MNSDEHETYLKTRVEASRNGRTCLGRGKGSRRKLFCTSLLKRFSKFHENPHETWRYKHEKLLRELHGELSLYRGIHSAATPFTRPPSHFLHLFERLRTPPAVQRDIYMGFSVPTVPRHRHAPCMTNHRSRDSVALRRKVRHPDDSCVPQAPTRVGLCWRNSFLGRIDRSLPSPPLRSYLRKLPRLSHLSTKKPRSRNRCARISTVLPQLRLTLKPVGRDITRRRRP